MSYLLGDKQGQLTSGFVCHRQNTFLDRINDEFFRPRGLYCLVMTWKPESPTLMLEVDISSSIADRMSTPDGLGAKTKRAMKTSSREGKIEFTECATLVYPKLDDLVASTGAEAETKKEKMKHYKGFADRYFDQRAQAKHVCLPSPQGFVPHLAVFR